MSTRCKMKLTAITRVAYDASARVVRFEAVYDESIPEDRRFHRWTPSGHLEMTVSNPAVIEALELGANYYLDLVPASSPTGGGEG